MMWDANESWRARECMQSLRVDENGKDGSGKRKEAKRNTNQHLLIASGVPRERSICKGRGEKRDRRTDR